MMLKQLIALGGFFGLQSVQASPVASGLSGRDTANSAALSTVVSFADSFTENLQPGEQVYDCDPIQQSCKAARSLELGPRQSTTTCVAPRVFSSSYCRSSSIAVVRCYDPNDQRYWPRWVTCDANSICVQRGEGSLQRARCVPIVDLVIWYTPDAGGDAVGTQNVHSTVSASSSAITTNYYDVNDNLMQVHSTKFLGLPGNIDEGVVLDANTAISSVVNWGQVTDMEVDVYTGGAGHIKVATFLSTQG